MFEIYLEIVVWLEGLMLGYCVIVGLVGGTANDVYLAMSYIGMRGPSYDGSFK